MRKLTLFITSLFLGIGMAQAISTGSLVTFTNVQQNGTEYVLYINDSDVLAVGEANKVASEYGDAAKFKAELRTDGKYSFYNEAKNLYLIIRGKGYGHNGDKGVLAEYDSYYCDITIVDGSSVKENTFCLRGQRDASYNRKGELIILKSGAFDAWDGAPACEANYSNLFRIDVVEEDVTVELIDTESGITFGGTYRGLRNITEPTLGWGCQLSNQVWNGNTLTADIQLPFAINEETMIAIHEPELLHRLYVDGENIRVDKTPFEYSNINDWIWKIHPVMTGNVVTFTIEHVATGKYAKAGDTNQHYKEGTVTLVEKESCNTFEIANYGSYPSFKVCEKNSYLSINSDSDESVALGLYGNTHKGTRIHFAPVPVATIDGVEYTTFAEALTAASAMTGDVTVELYDKVTLNSSLSGSYSSIKFVGKDTDAEIYLDVQGYITATGKTVAFEGLTLSKSKGVFITNAGFMNVAFGIYDVTEVTYTNCTFANGAYASSGTVTFNGCTFYRSHDKYGLWAYGNVETTVEDCTFADYRGIKMYAEGAAKTVDLTVKNTDFSAVTDKPAIVLTYGESVTLEGNTYSSTGTFELDLDGAPNGTLVTSDVAPVCVNDKGACGVLVDGKIYTTVAEAVAVATEGSNVTLLHSTTDTAEFAEGVNLTLADGVTADNVTVAVSVARIGDVKYATLEEAFTAATEDQTITMLDDATPALTSQRAITKAAVIDLGGYTMTLTEDDLYFGTTTFKNGTIVVDPSVKPSTAVFWMFANQTLTFVNVKIVATGVTGTYLIGLNGDNSDLNLLNGSEILVENTTALDLDIICVNASTGNDIKVEDSKVNVTNLDGRVFFRGNYTVKNSEVNLSGITKAGFRIEAGQTLSIEGTSKVNIEGEPRDGGIHLTDLSATYTKAETAIVNATVNEPKVAKIGENTYKTLAAAVEAVEDGGTITLIANETFTENNRAYNSGTWYDGLYYIGDKSFTIDLGGFTIGQDGSVNDYLLNFKNSGSKANTITLKNGTVDAGTAAYCALCTSSSQDNLLTINTENLNLINNNSNGSTIKFRGNAILNVKDGTVITGKDSYLGIECSAATVNIYDGAKIYMNGATSYNGCLAGVGGNGTINVYGGEGLGKSGGFIAMTSGGTINIEGGEWTANTDGTYANSNKSVLVAQSDNGAKSIINVAGGTFKGGYNCYGAAVGDAQINISGGNFNADPASYVAEDYIAVENNGVWNVEKAAAKIGTAKFSSLEDAFKAATADCTIDILSDVTVDYAWDARKTGAKFTVPVTINGNDNTIKFTASVNDNNYQAPFRFEADATVKNLTIDMSEATDSRFRAISSKGNLTVDGCKFIGKDETLNCRAIIFGEGAGANVGNLEISITNSEFINWRRGITDNENGQDVKTVTVTGNTLHDAAVYVSAKETVTFTGNTVEGAYVNIKSYTADNKLQVTATGNTLEENTDTAYNVINAGGKVEAEGFNIVAKGRDFSGYTGENRIWGETWGNAKESFVIKVLDANGNVMGTTSLNNVGGIINGDVTATWNLLFDAASNTDEYWTMEWTTAPSISNMPAKVALWVDGVEVSGGDVVLNGPDDLNKIVAAATDAEGKILSCHTSLAYAVATNATNIALLRETDEVVELPFGVTLDKNGFTAENVTETLPVAKIGDDAYFGTLQAALDAATDGQTVTLLTGITLTDADMVKIEGKYNVMMNVSGKDITLDLNEQTINIDYNGGQYLYAAVFVADGAGLTVTGDGKIDIAENGINVAYMFWKRGTTGHLTIENGTFHMDDSADSMVYTNGSEIVTVNGGTFTLDAIATRDNGFPCVFSAYGQNTANIIVNGGTYNYDVNHQYWAHEVNVPETLALKDNGDGTWTVVPAVAYAVEMRSGYNRHVGYTTLEEAIAAAETVVLLSDIETTDGYSIANGKKLTLDLNGKTIAATDNTSKNYGAIDNRGDLTITDSSEEQTGKITVTATVNSGYNRYSAVIANNPGGKLTVNGGTLEHLGGTDMAYGIDNLTNGKGTYAETIINGGVVKSPYRAIRQFLNGVEAQNILTINGGTIEGANKSVWMQDPSAKANTGTLTVGENAKLNGDVYLFVTAGSTEWPVEVSIAAAALQGESQVVTGNVPANWAVSNVNGTWGKVAAVATTGGVGYTSVTEAINAAEDGGVVEIFAGTIDEYIAPWAGNSKHDTEKSITIQGAADFGTVLTGGMYLGYDDSQCREHNIVVKGIHFTGKGLTVACQQNVTIEDNKFTDIEGRAIAVIGKNINSVVKNNVIENTTSVGIELRNTLTATVENNTISGTGHNALQITSQVGSTESVATVQNNTMSGWGVGGEGRAMRFEGIVTATVNGNVMSHTAAPEEFAKVTNSTTLDASQNYWNGVSPLAAGMFTGVEGDPAVVLKSYYTDAEKTNLVEFPATGSVARIGSVYFASLADAVAAAEANDVITFLTDINESVTISKSVTIDGADKQYTGTMTINTSLNVTVQNVNFVKGCITEAKGTHGYLTVKDCDFDGVDKSIGYAISVRGGDKVTIENSTAKNYNYGMLYVPSSVATINVKDVTVEDVTAAFNISYSGNGTFENVTLNNVTYGLHVQNYGARTFTLKNWNVTGSEYPIYVQEKGTANVTFAFEEVNDFGLTADKLIFSEYAIVKAEAVVGTKIYGSFLAALDAAQAGETVTLLTDITLAGGYEDAEEALRIEKAVTINGAGYTIDCGNLRKGIRVYNNGIDYARVRFENVTIKNDAAQGRCIDTRTGHITLELANSTLIAEGTNSQPLTIGGSEPAYRVDLLGATIKAGKSGYGVICFVPVQAGINAASNTVIEGLAAFYFKSDAGNTKLNLGHGTYTGTNLNPVESGSFGTVVVEGENNTITMNINLATIKAIAGDGAAQAAFNVRGAGNTIQITAEGAQVITEGAQAYRAMVKSDVAASTKLIDNGTELSLVAESNGVQFYSFEEAVRFAGNEGTVKLVNDVVLDNTWSVAAGQNITLDLNGKTMSMVRTEDVTANHTMISNSGNLTIESSVEGGKLSYTYTGADLGTSKSVNTITSNPGSVLTVKSGTIENLTYEQATIAYAIDGLTNGSAGDVTVNIEGGVITSKRQAVRIFANSTTNTGTLNISGGDLTGRVIVQNANANANKAVLNITDGTFNANDYKSDVLYVGGSQNATIDIEATVSGGKFNGEITETNVKGFISGGRFSSPVEAAYCAEGYGPYDFGDGTYGVEDVIIDDITLVDGEFTEFTNQNDKMVGTLTYERTFDERALGKWQALYVPFEIPVETLTALGYEVAYLYDVHFEEIGEDGEIDLESNFSVHLIKVKEGTLKANFPYVIKPTSTEALNLSLVLNDVKLYSTAASAMNSVESGSTTTRFVFAGTYKKANRSELTGDDAIPCYGITPRGTWGMMTSTATLGAFRVYLSILAKDGSPIIMPENVAESIQMRVIGEENEDGTTTIYDIEYDEPTTDYIYDLQGRRVLEPQKGSLYIINGKKVIF